MPNTRVRGGIARKKEEEESREKKFQGCRGSEHHSQGPGAAVGAVVRGFDPCPFLLLQFSFDILSLPLLLSLKPPLLHLEASSIHNLFTPNSPSFFLFLHFIHKSFNLHPKFTQTLHLLFSLSFLDLLLSTPNSPSFFTKIHFFTSILFFGHNFSKFVPELSKSFFFNFSPSTTSIAPKKRIKTTQEVGT